MLRRGFFLLEMLQPVVLAFAVFMMVYLFLFQPHKVDGNSMYPRLHNQEYLLTDKLSYNTGNPKRGDVIVFHAPPPSTSDYIKRIIALPGETIMVSNGRVYVNGQLLPEDYLPKGLYTNEKSFLRNNVPYQVPPGYYMAFGDNRNFSSDSREFGPISRKSIVGKAFFRYWPITVAGLIPHENYSTKPL